MLRRSVHANERDRGSNAAGAGKSSSAAPQPALSDQAYRSGALGSTRFAKPIVARGIDLERRNGQCAVGVGIAHKRARV